MKNKRLRYTALSMQIAAVALYYLPPLFTDGRVSVLWLLCGVLNTVLFCAVFYRKNGGRNVRGIVFTVINVLWCGFVLGFVLFILLMGLGVTASVFAYLYVGCALLAAVLGYVAPVKHLLYNSMQTKERDEIGGNTNRNGTGG
jgi:peptidoglycan biosynthesis protein MviN/MurJ (putative lipid II flippase)